jgi:hypothetical protein
MNFFQAPALYSASVVVAPPGSTLIPVPGLVGTSATATTMTGYVGYGETGIGNGTWIVYTGGTGSAPLTVMRSIDDGTTWTSITVSATAGLSATSIAYGNGVWWLSAYGVLYTSTTDGVTWTKDTTLATLAAGHVGRWEFKYANGTWVAIMSSDNNITYNQSSIAATSPDGVTWTKRTLPAAQNYASITYNPDLNIWMAINQGDGSTPTVPPTTATSVIRSADNGVTWTTQNFPIALSTATTMLYFNKKYWVCTSGSTMYSSVWNGSDWILTSPSPTFTANANTTMAVYGSVFQDMVLTRSNTGANAGSFVYSVDGANWDVCTFMTPAQAAVNWGTVWSNGAGKALAFSRVTTGQTVQCMLVISVV